MEADGVVVNKLRVLALTTSYPLHPGSNAGVFVQNLYRHLAGDDVIDVVCPADAQPDASLDGRGSDDIRVHAVRYAPRGWRVLAQQSGGVLSSVRRAPWRALLVPLLLAALFWRCLRCAHDTDLIHANWAICGVIAGIVGRLRGKPVVTTLRGSDVARAARAWTDRMILDMAVRNSRIVICVSEPMAAQVRARYPRRASDVHACLNGVDEVFFGISRQPSDDKILRVLAVGNLIRLKGFDVLIEAVAGSRHRECIRACIVGDGPERQSLRALAIRHGVSSCFDFVGSVAVSGMPARYAAADVFVLASRSEGRPNVVAEALASGLPVISTHLEGVQGMVEDGHNGWLVPVDDAARMTSALDQAAASRGELDRRAGCARASARARIGTWADTAHCYQALFRTIAASGGSAQPPCAA